MAQFDQGSLLDKVFSPGTALEESNHSIATPQFVHSIQTLRPLRRSGKEKRASESFFSENALTKSEEQRQSMTKLRAIPAPKAGLLDRLLRYLNNSWKRFGP